MVRRAGGVGFQLSVCEVGVRQNRDGKGSGIQGFASRDIVEVEKL